MTYHASPVSDHSYAYMFNVEAILDSLQSSDAFVVKDISVPKPSLAVLKSRSSMFPETIVDAPISERNFQFLPCGHSKPPSVTLFQDLIRRLWARHACKPQRPENNTGKMWTQKRAPVFKEKRFKEPDGGYR